MDYRKEASILSIPILNEFVPSKPEFEKTCFVATKGPIIEQLTNDGKLLVGETLEQRINKIINSTKEYMKHNNYIDVDDNYFHYVDYNNGVFDFYIYIQDLETNDTAIRLFNVFFLEPKLNNVYLLNLSAGPFAKPLETLKTGLVDVDDKVTNELLKILNIILTNLKYK